MLGRLALVIHWGMYVWVGFLLIDELNVNGFKRLNDTDTFYWIIPFAIFTLLYWIVKKHWAIFPWQHVKTKASKDE